MHDKIEIDDKILSIYLSCLVTAVLIWEKIFLSAYVYTNFFS